MRVFKCASVSDGNGEVFALPCCRVPGYYCPPGSIVSTARACPAGQYSLAGAATCTVCGGGQFGSSPALPTSACSGACAAGYFCPNGSTSAQQVICPVGLYSAVGSAQCSACPIGRYGSSQGLPSVQCSGPCGAGSFGATTGLTAPSCSGACSAGMCTRRDGVSIERT